MAEEQNPLHTRFCEMFGLEYPIAAFTHCPDTVYEVCNAGGIGILGISGAGYGDKTMAEEVEESIKLIKYIFFQFRIFWNCFNKQKCIFPTRNISATFY